MKRKNESRGYRNNNPLNIIKTAGTLKYVGASKVQTDPNFVQFQSKAYGYRAAIVLLHTYYFKHGLKTIEGIVRRWCPDHTAASYAALVSKRMKWPQDEALEWNALAVAALVLAMAHVENGYLTDNALAEIEEAWKMYLEWLVHRDPKLYAQLKPA